MIYNKYYASGALCAGGVFVCCEVNKCLYVIKKNLAFTQGMLYNLIRRKKLREILYMTIKEKILQKKTCLGIELGSTRIKACLIDDTYTPIAGGSCSWENRFENGYWTYSLDDIHSCLRACYADLCRDVMEKYGTELTGFGAMGISAMMHGYMAFDEEGELLVPFRTWRNTTTEKAAEELSQLLQFNIPQRWSISHLYQAILNGEEHLSRLAGINTLAGYIHSKLTGISEVGVGEASGMFPVNGCGYDKEYLSKVQQRLSEMGFEKDLADILPAVRSAGDAGAHLTDEGAAFLDPSGKLRAGVPVCPPEGDAGTGMTATNSVLPRTGNVSAGTSVFSMLVLDKPLEGFYPEIDIVTTPDGAPVAMVHCNNCCGELDMWVNMFGEFAELAGISLDRSELYSMLYTNAMKHTAGDTGIAAYNFISGEPVAGVSSGKPMYFRSGDRSVGLGSFFRAQLYSASASLKIGMDILFDKEKVTADGFTGHGGLFKVQGTAQQIMADALRTPVTTMETAGEGGAWGMALLAAYMLEKDEMSLPEFLQKKVFSSQASVTLDPDAAGSEDFDRFMENYISGLFVQRAASEI